MKERLSCLRHERSVSQHEALWLFWGGGFFLLFLGFGIEARSQKNRVFAESEKVVGHVAHNFFFYGWYKETSPEGGSWLFKDTRYRVQLLIALILEECESMREYTNKKMPRIFLREGCVNYKIRAKILLANHYILFGLIFSVK